VPTHPLFILIFHENVAYRSLRFRRGCLHLSLVSVHHLPCDGVEYTNENYLYRFFSDRCDVLVHTMQHGCRRWLNYVRIVPGGDAAWFRTRFRLKLYESAVKCLGDVDQLKFLALRPSLDLNIFTLAWKTVLSQSFSLIRHSSLSVYMYRFIPPGSLEKTRYYSREGYQPRQIASRHLRWNQKFVTFDESPFFTDLPEGTIFFLFEIFQIRHVESNGISRVYPSWRYSGEIASLPITREHR